MGAGGLDSEKGEGVALGAGVGDGAGPGPGVAEGVTGPDVDGEPDAGVEITTDDEGGAIMGPEATPMVGIMS
jgi:hypothetical protein